MLRTLSLPQSQSLLLWPDGRPANASVYFVYQWPMAKSRAPNPKPTSSSVQDLIYTTPARVPEYKRMCCERARSTDSTKSVLNLTLPRRSARALQPSPDVDAKCTHSTPLWISPFWYAFVPLKNPSLLKCEHEKKARFLSENSDVKVVKNCTFYALSGAH